MTRWKQYGRPLSREQIVEMLRDSGEMRCICCESEDVREMLVIHHIGVEATRIGYPAGCTINAAAAFCADCFTPAAIEAVKARAIAEVEGQIRATTAAARSN